MLPDRSIQIAQKLVENAKIKKIEGCGQTVLPDRSTLTRQKLMENVNIKKVKCDSLSNFQTLCARQEGI